jgi:hypothetical protein
MKTLFHLFTAAAALLLSQVTAYAANDLLEWRHDFVSGLTPNSRGVDVAMNNKGCIASVAYTTSGADEKWFITRHDNFTGTVMWQKIIAVSGQDCRPVAAAMDEYGRIFVTGYVGGTNGRDTRTYCYAKDGTQSWAHTFNGASNGNDQPTALALDSDGNVIVTGTTTGSSLNIITLRLNANTGGEMWSQIYSTTSDDVPAAISCSPYGGYIIVAGKSRTGSTACSLVLRYDQDTGTATPNIINDAAKDDEATDVITDGAAAIYIARRIRNSAISYTAAISRVDPAGGAMMHQASISASTLASVTSIARRTLQMPCYAVSRASTLSARDVTSRAGSLMALWSGPKTPSPLLVQSTATSGCRAWR